MKRVILRLGVVIYLLVIAYPLAVAAGAFSVKHGLPLWLAVPFGVTGGLILGWLLGQAEKRISANSKQEKGENEA